MQASPVTNSIRDAKALEVGLNKIDNAILYHNAAVLLGKTPKVTYAPVEWDKITRFFKLAVRDDTAEHIRLHKLAVNGYQIDHVFEVQYFSVVLLHTLAEMMAGDISFRPEVEDIAYAVKLVNSTANLKPITTAFHKFKTAYFRAGNANPQVSADLLKYLKDAVPDFKQVLDIANGSIKNFNHRHAFKEKLIANLLTTPWCNAEQWNNILAGNAPFSKNLTLENYVPNGWGDDNEFYKA